MQMIFELAIFVAGFTGLSYMLNAMGMAFPRFWQGILFWAFILSVPQVSDLSSDSIQRPGHVWHSFPRRRVYVGVGERRRLEEVQTADYECAGCADAVRTRLLRYGYLVLLPLLIGWLLLQRHETEIRRADRVADSASGSTGQHEGAWENLYAANVTEPVSCQSGREIRSGI